MLTALVVDADALARRRVIGLLRLGGWDVQEASDVAAALRMAGSTSYDLVVTDVTVAGEDGLELLRRLRRDGSHARFVVVTVLAHAIFGLWMGWSALWLTRKTPRPVRSFAT